MKQLKMNSSELVAWVDDDDHEMLSQHSWRIKKDIREGSYPRPIARVGSKIIKLHRLIMEAQPGEQIDHRNGDTLDNQKHNLRRCNSCQNAQNSKRKIGNKSGYKGVHWQKDKAKWRAEIWAFKTRYHLGYFSSLFDAAFARKEAELTYHKEFAYSKF
jgi:hypothetical protein